MKEKLENLILVVLKKIGIEAEKAELEHPAEMSHGDWSTNVAMVYAKDLKANPKELALKIIEGLNKKKTPEIERIEVAGPGFINFFLSREFFTDRVKEILDKKSNFGRIELWQDKKVMIEYTQPNPFKEFHIGHLMSNSIGETISRLIEFSGAEVRRANYQGDVGIHVAKAIAGMFHEPYTQEDFVRGRAHRREIPSNSESLAKKVEFLGSSYAAGAAAYERHEDARAAIEALNKIIYEQSDPEINKLYKLGRSWSLEYFEGIYKKLGTSFDFYFFESESGKVGADVVRKFQAGGLPAGARAEAGSVFEESEGAIVFRGEKYDPSLHTRVFINSAGFPTYEAKELGLAKVKAEKYSYDESIVVTANEVNEYFNVVLKAMELVYPDLAKKTRHVSHGMMLGPDGKKMSSRTGEVLPAEDLIAEVEKRALSKIEESEKEFSPEEKREIAEAIAIGAIKYSILKQSPGKDIIFDIERSLSFEGDSGPYLQYTYTRASSVLEKAEEADIKILGYQDIENIVSEANKYRERSEQISMNVGAIERLLYRFPEIVERALLEYEPQHITTYLIDLAQAFNSFYGAERIVDPEDKTSPYKVALTKAISIILKNGLWLLGIKTPTKM